MPEVLRKIPDIAKVSKPEGAHSVQVTGPDAARSLARSGEVQSLNALKDLAPSGDIFNLKIGGMTTSSEPAGRGTVNVPTFCGN